MDSRPADTRGYDHKLGTVLLKLARQAIEDAFKPDTDTTDTALPGNMGRLHPLLNEKMATFVTLHDRQGALRGCIGSLEPRDALGRDVVRNARHAAFHDTRFPPLTQSELPAVFLEVSLLTPPVDLVYQGSADLKQKIIPGVHGVILQKGGAGATFLPQVWDQVSDTDAFLTQLCRKAGLPPRTWAREPLSIRTYTVHSFSESAAG